MSDPCVTATSTETSPPSGWRTGSSSGSEPLEEIDEILSREGLFALAPEEALRLRLGCLRKAAKWHLHPKSPYARHAERQGFRPAMLESPEGLDALPLLPSLLFKRPGLDVIHPEARDVLWTTSSGTRGSVSRVPRDDLTLQRFFASIGAFCAELLDVLVPDVVVLNLGPSAAEARTLWISYVMAGVAVLMPLTRNYVSQGVLDLERAVKDLEAAGGRRVSVIGPPMLLIELSDRLLASGKRLKLAPGSTAITIGGWKRAAGGRVPRHELNERIHAALGVDLAQVRDAFNMVELNTVLIECSAHRMHVPAWLHVRARDPATLAVLPSGATGVLAFLDPTPTSYPGFILSDDLGRVEEAAPCECGRRSDILVVERRLNTMEERGCALKLDGLRVQRSG